MFGRKKATHVITGPPGEVDKAFGQARAVATVYGRRDLRRRLAAAKELGVEVSVRKLKRGEQ